MNTKLWVLGAAIASSLVVAALASAGAGLVVVEQTATAPGDGPGSATASARCPGGRTPALAGYRREAGGGTQTPTALKATQRAVEAGLLNWGSQPSDVTAIAYCSRADGVVVRSRVREIPAHPTEAPVDKVAVRCRAGERLVYGGFSYRNPAEVDFYLAGLRARRSRKWVVSGFAFSGPDQPVRLKAIAYCSQDAPRTVTESKSVPVAADSPRAVTANCPRGRRLAYGGYKATVTYSEAFVLLRRLERETSRRWRVAAENENGIHAGRLTAFAYCA